jgi:hypothetical protein
VTKGAERTRWKIRSDRTVDENPRIRLSVATLELADGTDFDQYVNAAAAVERGTHEELLAWGEVYPAMVRAQQSGPGIGSVRLDRVPVVLAKDPTDMHLSCVDVETSIAR